ncbi:hypothetical protein BRC98_04235 [Halobacteriales archaeon QS_7_68_65]|nr:MAG: hypothetical protein BRC98_04235 [Halobacteriales archaeon QS_7_68_65]
MSPSGHVHGANHADERLLLAADALTVGEALDSSRPDVTADIDRALAPWLVSPTSISIGRSDITAASSRKDGRGDQ